MRTIHFCRFDTHKLIVSVLLCLFLWDCSAHKKASTKEVSLDTKIGQMIKVGFRGLSVDTSSTISAMIQKQHIGGVVLFDYDVPADSALRNIKAPAQVRKLTRQLQNFADIPLFIAVDQEGGRVTRLKEKFGFPASVSAQHLGELNNLDSTRHHARKTAATLAGAGINVNLAPVVDLDLNPDNQVIGGLERSFSADPETVIRHAKVFIDELHKKGILATLKHFPGHGSSEDDSHKGLVDITDSWQEQELIPYRRLIESGHADIIMTAHVYNSRLDSTYPATLSKPTITGVLRDSLGFEGVVMSDDLQMGAIRKHYELKETIKLAIQAGVDILCFANNSVFDPKIAKKAHDIIKELAENGEISEQRITESYERILKLKDQINEE